MRHAFLGYSNGIVFYGTIQELSVISVICHKRVTYGTV